MEQREHVEVLRERIDVRRPARAVAPEAVQQHDGRAAARLQVVQRESEHGDVSGGGVRARLSRRGEHEREHAGEAGEAFVRHSAILASRAAIYGILFGCE